MRVLIVCQYFWPETFRINDISSDLVKRGHSVTVLTGVPNYPTGDVFPDYKKDPLSYASFEGVSIVRVPIMARGQGGVRLFLNYLSYAVMASTYGVYKLRKKTFDIIYCFQLSPVTIGVPAIVLRKVKKTPLILQVLDLWPESLQAVGMIRSDLILSIVRQVVRFIYNRCDLLLGQSHGFVQHIKQHTTRKRIEYFPSWADEIFSKPQINKRNNGNKNHFNIVFAGNVGEAQDFPAIIEAIELTRLDEAIHWTIVGDGRLSGWLEDEVVRRELADCVTLAGRYPVEKMPDFFEQSDALLVSLKSEPVFSLTIPAKIQAYLSAGKPILAMLDGEGNEIIKKAQCGIAVSSGDSEGLAKAALSLAKLSDIQLLGMGNKGVQFSRNEFNRNALMDKLEAWMIECSREVTV